MAEMRPGAEASKEGQLGEPLPSELLTCWEPGLFQRTVGESSAASTF